MQVVAASNRAGVSALRYLSKLGRDPVLRWSWRTGIAWICNRALPGGLFWLLPLLNSFGCVVVLGLFGHCNVDLVVVWDPSQPWRDCTLL